MGAGTGWKNFTIGGAGSWGGDRTVEELDKYLTNFLIYNII